LDEEAGLKWSFQPEIPQEQHQISINQNDGTKNEAKIQQKKSREKISEHVLTSETQNPVVCNNKSLCFYTSLKAVLENCRDIEKNSIPNNLSITIAHKQ